MAASQYCLDRCLIRHSLSTLSFSGKVSCNFMQTEVPQDGVVVRSAEKLAITLRTNRADAELFRILVTLVTTVPVGTVDEWKWSGPTDRFAAVADSLGAPQLVDRLRRLIK